MLPLLGMGTSLLPTFIVKEEDDAGDAFLTIEEQQNLETFMYDSDASKSDQVTGYK